MAGGDNDLEAQLRQCETLRDKALADRKRERGEHAAAAAGLERRIAELERTVGQWARLGRLLFVAWALLCSSDVFFFFFFF
jgi:hypothetical protein